MVKRFSVVALLLLVPFVSSAAALMVDKETLTTGEQTIAEDAYFGAGTITSSSRILGDLVAVGGNVTLKGPVAVDGFVVGGSVTVLGPIGDDLRVAGGNITIGAPIEGDLILAGGNVTVAGDHIGGDVLGAGGNITISTPVRGDIHLKGGEIYLNAPVGGNVILTAQKVTLGSAAVIGGSFTYEASEEAVMTAGARVSGATNYIHVEPSKSVNEKAVALFSALFLFKFLSALIGALFLGLFFHRYSTTLVMGATAAPLADFGRGLIAMIVLPILSALLLISFVGMPFGLLGLLAFVALLVVGCMVTPILIGSTLWKWLGNEAFMVNWKTILLGVVAYFLLGFIPVVGWLILCIVSLIAIGAIVRIKWGVAREWR